MIDGSMMDEFAEWALPVGSRPNDVVVDSSGEVWILESSTNKVARLSLTPDFTIECDPSSFTVIQSNNGTSTCTVTSIDGFTSTVVLAGSWVGAEPTGVAYTLDTAVTPPPGRGVSSTLVISAGAIASPGTFTLQVTATSGSLIHSADVTVTIGAGAADFAITISPSYLPVVPGGSATSTITVQSVGVFFSPVHLTSSGAPDGMSLTFGTNPVTPPIGGTASSILSVSVSGTPTGTYTITITGTSGSLARAITLTVEVTGGGACLIATATYGSELSDEVQFLREFRDNSILRTSTGSSFMIAFNAWYYSFSPSVAQFIREHPAFGSAAKVALYPLIGILRIGAAVFHLFPANLEAGAVVSGLVVSSLVGLVYLAPPLTAVLARSARARRLAKRLQMPAVAVLLGALAAVGLITALTGPAVVMMAATSTIVLASLIASALFASRVILRMTGRL
jgi:hypothetical protein